jgi:hypothetical protein
VLPAGNDGNDSGDRVDRVLVDSMGRTTGRELDTDRTLLQPVRDVFHAVVPARMAAAPRRWYGQCAAVVKHSRANRRKR